MCMYLTHLIHPLHRVPYPRKLPPSPSRECHREALDGGRVDAVHVHVRDRGVREVRGVDDVHPAPPAEEVRRHLPRTDRQTGHEQGHRRTTS